MTENVEAEMMAILKAHPGGVDMDEIEKQVVARWGEAGRAALRSTIEKLGSDEPDDAALIRARTDERMLVLEAEYEAAVSSANALLALYGQGGEG